MNNYTFEGRRNEFESFLANEIHNHKYTNRLRETIADGKFRLIVNINDLRAVDQSLASDLLRHPRDSMLALQKAAESIALGLDPSYSKVLASKEIQIGFEGSLGSNAVSPRGLLSNILNHLVDVEGIVTKCSNVRPKLVKSVHYCPATNQHTLREYRDSASLDVGVEIDGRVRLPTSSVFPTTDAQGNELELEFGHCQYKDYQTVLVQEMPERARVGQLPRSIEIILEHDLVDKVKAGDRVKCVGVYRPLTGATNQTGQISGVFPTVLIANNISVIGKEVGGVTISSNEVKNIREVAGRSDILEIMAKSLCPSIFGHEFVKRALILQLLGGCERNLENGTHIRGDINVLLVGDPSTAKSQLLRSILDIAPLAISTTGRGSSGVGLTAAVTSDAETGERRLEAGAMVLADRGIVCVDEFDKMSENDRVAIHEVMEQQTVTIAKAGIHASLNARCSVLAAANPVYGQYDRSRRPQENIGLPDSLLSRFDLLFIVLDQLDPDVDRRLSEHVIRSHQYRRPGTLMEPEPLNFGSSLAMSLEDDQATREADVPVWLRGGGKSQSNNNINSGKGDIFTKEFLRKYIHYARNRINPVLSEGAMTTISSAYAAMRAKQTRRNLPITARTLETMIRLSTASARARLSNVVDIIDAECALDLINFVMFHEIGGTGTSGGDDAKLMKMGGSLSGLSHGKVGTSNSSNSNNNNNNNKKSKDHSKNKDDDENGSDFDDNDNDDIDNHDYDNDDNDNDNGDDNGDYKKRHKRQRKSDNNNDKTLHGDDEDDDDLMDGNSNYVDMPVDRSSQRYAKVMVSISKISQTKGVDSFDMELLLSRLNDSSVSMENTQPYSRRELVLILKDLQEQNKIMYEEGTIHLL